MRKRVPFKKIVVILTLSAILLFASSCGLFGLNINAFYPVESPRPPATVSPSAPAPSSGTPEEPPDTLPDVLEPNAMQSLAFLPHLIGEAEREAEPYRYWRDGERGEGKVGVRTSEQLFNAADKGQNFEAETGSSADYVLAAAEDVLDKIILNDMTEFERAHAIYDWLIYTVEYDYELLEKYEKNPNDPTIASDPAFRMEGVFYDRLAVCDGMSKAYTLLCRIEQIECIQIVGDSNGIGHAWNKVYLHKPQYRDCEEGTPNQTMCTNPLHRAWYTVDLTWGNLGVQFPERTEECLTHAYFLVSDASIADGHTERPSSDGNLDQYPDSNANYGYFQYASAYPAVDAPRAYVRTYQELYAALEYAVDHSLSGLEIQCALREKDLTLFQRMQLTTLAGAAFNGSVNVNARVFLLYFSWAAQGNGD